MKSELLQKISYDRSQLRELVDDRRNPPKICPCHGGRARTHLAVSVRRLGARPESKAAKGGSLLTQRLAE
jgi:hypothetical protein